MQLHVVGTVAVPLFDSTTHGSTAEAMMYREPVRFFPWHRDVSEISSCVGL
jgi:hypothetical protein